MAKLKVGDSGYIIESNRIVREIIVLRSSGGFYLIRFKDGDGAIKVKEHRLYKNEEDAVSALKANKPM